MTGTEAKEFAGFVDKFANGLLSGEVVIKRNPQGGDSWQVYQAGQVVADVAPWIVRHLWVASCVRIVDNTVIFVAP